eukprot:TRINITY_DN6260_c0_g1_i2.p3 TRINITY_DN6260_c0_g1~~TRINITY_DN6260_c0_g1_i2.p3  ORF type:complete len:170 (-),score=11.15 TRINITY_DN6260_c0_g1_i2:499-1008(-)
MSDQYEDFQSENSLSLLIVLLLVLCVLSYLPHYLSYLLILSTLAFLAIVVYHLKHVQQKQKNQQQVDNQNQSQSQNNEAKKLSTDANRRPNQEIDDDVLNQLQLPQQQEDYSPQKSFSVQQAQIFNNNNKITLDHCSNQNGVPCNCIAHSLSDLFARHSEKFAKYKPKE